jgi:putative hydrolase of the HAD superfamily
MNPLLGSTLKAVTFDVGGTLIEPWPSVGQVYTRVALRHGITGLNPELVQRSFLTQWTAATNFRHSREAWRQLATATLQPFTNRASDPNLFNSLWEEFRGGSAWRRFPDADFALPALKRAGLRLAVISNWDERLESTLNELDLSGFFEQVLVSETVGLQKPDPAIFAEAARRLDLKPCDILHVGDHYREDIQGALSAGFEALRIVREGAPGPGEAADLGQVAHWVIQARA